MVANATAQQPPKAAAAATAQSTISLTKKTTTSKKRKCRLSTILIIISMLLLAGLVSLNAIHQSTILQLQQQQQTATGTTEATLGSSQASQSRSHSSASHLLTFDTTHSNPLVRLLLLAKVISPAEFQSLQNHPLNQSLVVHDNNTLPPWTDYEALYYPSGDNQLYIHGMETCRRYQQLVAPAQRVAAVAGMFNTGTNAMDAHLGTNLYANGDRQLHPWQVPWGKHRMAFQRLHHTADGLGHWNQSLILPIIMIRDPLHWMQSMCKSPYAAHWRHKWTHCPNLIPTEIERTRFFPDADYSNGTVPVYVQFSKILTIHWSSLLHLYTDYYQQYFDYKNNDNAYPRLIIRFEDMLLHPHAVMSSIAHCLGISSPISKEQMQIQTKSAKQHGSHAGWLQALAKTGMAERRTAKMTREDLQFIRGEYKQQQQQNEVVFGQFHKLVKEFGYRIP